MARPSPQQRLLSVVLSADVGIDLDSAEWMHADVTAEPWMVAELRHAETSARRLRLQLEQRLPGAGQPRHCARCGEPFSGRPDKVYCSSRCRQEAHRLRHEPGGASTLSTSGADTFARALVEAD
jgi:hypothetical protein